MQRTLILLKPDAVSKKICGKVISRFEEAGLTIIGCKMMQLTPEILREHYAHIASKPFYPEVEQFMSSTPVIAMVLGGEDMMINVAHASDGLESAEIEVKRFFRPDELFTY